MVKIPMNKPDILVIVVFMIFIYGTINFIRTIKQDNVVKSLKEKIEYEREKIVDLSPIVIKSYNDLNKNYYCYMINDCNKAFKVGKLLADSDRYSTYDVCIYRDTDNQMKLTIGKSLINCNHDSISYYGTIVANKYSLDGILYDNIFIENDCIENVIKIIIS